MGAENPNRQAVLPVRDLEVTPEREKLVLTKILVISGPSYTGKDLVSQILNERNGWLVVDGRERFERRTGVETGHMQRSPDIHRRFDGFQAKFFRKATPSDAAIWQTRLGGIILAEERDRRAKEIQKQQWAQQKGVIRPEIGLIPAVSILLWARKDVRVDRAYNVALENWEVEVKNLSEDSIFPTKPTKTDILAKIEERAKGDIEDWAQLHPTYIKTDSDPFDPKLSRQNGGPVYDRIVDTSTKTPEEVADEVIELAKALGAIESYENIPGNGNHQSLHNGEPLSPRIG